MEHQIFMIETPNFFVLQEDETNFVLWCKDHDRDLFIGTKDQVLERIRILITDLGDLYLRFQGSDEKLAQIPPKTT